MHYLYSRFFSKMYYENLKLQLHNYKYIPKESIICLNKFILIIYLV